MKKTISQVALVVFCVAFIAVGVLFGPEIYDRLYANNGRWIDEKFTEEMRKVSELKVFEYEQNGKETYEKGFRLLGFEVITRTIEIPYALYLDYTVDLSVATVTVEDSTITIAVPPPQINAFAVTPDAEVKQSYLAGMLSPEYFNGLMTELNQRLYDENVNKPEHLTQAWDGTEEALQNLFNTVMSNEEFDKTYTIVVVQDASLAATETQQPQQ